MLSAPMLCWRKDNTVLQPAEMTSQHSICISKPWLNSAAICACVRGRVLVLCMSELHVLADPHSCTCCAAISLHTRRQVVPGPPQLYFFPDKLAHCFLETIMIIKKKEAQLLGCKHFSKPDPCCCGSASFDTICHLVASLSRSCRSTAGFTFVWTEHTSRADGTMAADIDSSGLGPAPRAATLTEARTLKAEAQRLKSGFLCPSTNHWTKWEDSFMCSVFDRACSSGSAKQATEYSWG